MAESFPVGFARIGLVIRTGMTRLRETGGLLVTGRRSEGYWGGTMTTGNLMPDEHADLLAFLCNCVERNLRVDFVHPRFALPRAYSAGSWPLLDDPTLAGVTDLHTVSVAGLSLGLTLRRGDRLTLIQDELRCHRMVSADVTVVSETVQAIPVVPRLPIGVFSPAALVRFKDPPVRLAIVPDSFEAAAAYAPTPVSFEVEEALA